MTQEVRVMLQLTLDVNTLMTKEDIERNIKGIMESDEVIDRGINVMMTDIIEIREEAEIYGNE